ncbi:hypothetical protein [Dechloromonas sp. HYN0024]|uniref:hypothetical protein n=1 Tax=Dechloromonas sp. HYN0024 TaxID=2231055 RepID=UPI0013C32345|nr:hypothetical protein [Dechloromonas sp. HYN0024]
MMGLVFGDKGVEVEFDTERAERLSFKQDGLLEFGNPSFRGWFDGAAQWVNLHAQLVAEPDVTPFLIFRLQYIQCFIQAIDLRGQQEWCDGIDYAIDMAFDACEVGTFGLAYGLRNPYEIENCADQGTENKQWQEEL